MKKFYLQMAALLCLSLMPVSIYSAEARELLDGGGIDSGGGDPLALEFLQAARFIQSSLAYTTLEGVDVDTDKLKEKITALEASLEGHDPLLVFPAGETVECFGAPKLGCVNKGKIHIARDGWAKADMNGKIQVTAMELLLTLGIKGRYAKAALISAELSPRLIFSGTNILLSKSTDKARKFALKKLNEPKNELRKKILENRSENCIEASEECRLASDAADNNKYLFTDADIVSATFIGEGASEEPCKSDHCTGFDHETRKFLILVATPTNARWGYSMEATALALTYSRDISQANGSFKTKIELSWYLNPITQ